MIMKRKFTRLFTSAQKIYSNTKLFLMILNRGITFSLARRLSESKDERQKNIHGIVCRVSMEIDLGGIEELTWFSGIIDDINFSLFLWKGDRDLIQMCDMNGWKHFDLEEQPTLNEIAIFFNKAITKDLPNGVTLCKLFLSEVGTDDYIEIEGNILNQFFVDDTSTATYDALSQS